MVSSRYKVLSWRCFDFTIISDRIVSDEQFERFLLSFENQERVCSRVSPSSSIFLTNKLRRIESFLEHTASCNTKEKETEKLKTRHIVDLVTFRSVSK